jgi:energy-converting hydrogenase Eha subunit G
MTVSDKRQVSATGQLSTRATSNATTMLILRLLGYCGLLVGFSFLTLSIASGLYYLSELVEENTVVTRKALYRLIYGICILNVCLWLFDGFPFWLCALSFASHIVYSGNLAKFPVVQLSDPGFIASCCKHHPGR